MQQELVRGHVIVSIHTHIHTYIHTYVYMYAFFGQEISLLPQMMQTSS